jgi:5'(3')-deoxyribonucleotidase
MKRIAIDMDEVLAKYTKKVISTLKSETGYEVDLKKVEGDFLSKSLPKKYVELVTEYPFREGFFRDLEVMENSKEVLLRLNKKYEIYIVSSTLQHPNAPKDKLGWLHEHFPFIHFRNVVFCGDKSIIRADYLIDDHPRHLEAFHGESIIFSAFHNIHERRFHRADNWKEVESLINKNEEF